MPTIKKRERPARVRFKHADNDGSKYYNSMYWKRLRNAYIREHPLCEMCLLDRKTTAAAEVHHIVPFMQGDTDDERWELLLDPDNLMPLCESCHHKVHNEMRKKMK